MKKTTNSELNRPTLEKYIEIPKLPIVIVADNIRSLHNIGAIFRTMDAFLFERLCLCGITGTPPNREIHKSALGAELSVKWSYYKETMDAIKELKEEGYTIVSIEQVHGSISLDKFTVETGKKYAFVFGNEVKGVMQEVVDASHMCVEIPQLGTKHSLNVSVASGIVMWHLFKDIQG